MKKLFLLALFMAGIVIFASVDLFAQMDTLRTDTLWYDNFNDGCTAVPEGYDWFPMDWGGTTTLDCSGGEMVVKTSNSGTGVLAYSFGNLFTDCENYTIRCKAMFSGTTGWQNFQVHAKMDLSGTRFYTALFESGGIWIFEPVTGLWLAWGASPAIRVDTFFNAKVTVAGDVILAKAWDPDSSEPDWQVAYTTASVPGGFKQVWRGARIGGYWLDSIKVDDFIVYGSYFCDYPAGDVNGDNANPSLLDVIWLAKYVFGFPGFPLIECPSGR